MVWVMIGTCLQETHLNLCNVPRSDRNRCMCVDNYNIEVECFLKFRSNLVDPTMWFPSAPLVSLQGAEGKRSGNGGRPVITAGHSQ